MISVGDTLVLVEENTALSLKKVPVYIKNLVTDLILTLNR